MANMDDTNVSLGKRYNVLFHVEIISLVITQISIIQLYDMGKFREAMVALIMLCKAIPSYVM